MIEAPRQLKPKYPIAKQLRELGITKVAIIDDAYDSPNEDLLKDEIADFWNIVERDEEMISELKTLGLNINQSEDINNEVLKALWDKRDHLDKLKDPFANKLFPGKFNMMKELNSLSEHLQNLELEIITYGNADNLPDSSIKLIFLDYFLDTVADATINNFGEIIEKGKRATEIAKKIYQQVVNEDKPFIVLMSSVNLEENITIQFQKDTNILGGLFGFMPKEYLQNQEQKRLLFRLSSLGIGMKTHHEIQRFIDALIESIEATSIDFKNKIRELAIQDYAHIQRLSLHEDGHPLGDYILRLYESLFGYLLRSNSNVFEKEKILNAMIFDDLLPCQKPPSLRLAEMYRFSITEPCVEELGRHPRAKEDGEDSKKPFLQLGDIFIKDNGQDALLVINAACDLAFAPGAIRPIDGEQPIFFTPGKLQAISDKPNDNESIITELFEYENKPFRLIWDHKHVQSHKFDKVWQWLIDQKYSRKARLRIPYSLEVQRKFASHLTRIGMPVPPPIHQIVDIEIYLKGNNEPCKRIDSGAFIICQRVKNKLKLRFGFIESFVETLLGELDKVATELEKTIQQPDKANGNNQIKIVRDTDKAKKIRECISNYELLSLQTKLLDLPETGKPAGLNKSGFKEHGLEDSILLITRNGDFSGELRNLSLIIINIKYDVETEELENALTSDKKAQIYQEGEEDSGLMKLLVKIFNKIRHAIDYIEKSVYKYLRGV